MSSSPCCKVCRNAISLKSRSSSSSSPFKRTSADWNQLSFLIGTRLLAPFCATCTGQLSHLLGLIKKYNIIENELKRGIVKFKKKPGLAAKLESNQAPKKPKIIPKRPRVRKTIAALKPEPPTSMETEMEQIDKDDDQDNTNIPKKPSQSVAKLPPLILDRRFYMDTEYAPINNTLTCLRCGWCTNSVAEATKAFDICTHIKTEHKHNYRCPHCDRKFASFQLRKKHLENICLSVVPCEICEKPVPPQKLREHTWSHKSCEEMDAALNANCETAFITCLKCGKLYDGVTKLMQHQRACNVNWHDELDIIPAAATSAVTCAMCGRPLISEALLPRHEWSHLNSLEKRVAIRGGQMPKFRPCKILLENGEVSEMQIRKWMAEQEFRIS